MPPVQGDSASDPRLQAEVDTLRKRAHDVNNAMNSVTLGITEIKAILANQDKTLAKQDCVLERVDEGLNGDGKGKPGLFSRMTAVEKTVAGYNKFLWLAGGTLATLVIHAIYRLVMKQ